MDETRIFNDFFPVTHYVPNILLIASGTGALFLFLWLVMKIEVSLASRYIAL